MTFVSRRTRFRWIAFVTLVLAGCCGPVWGADSAAFTIVAWGDNSHAQLTVPAAATEIAAVAAGDGHVLALRSDGQLLAWGRNDAGQTNLPKSATDPATPQRFAAIAAGPRHSVGWSFAGLVSWGAVTAVPDLPAFSGPLRGLAAGGDFNVVIDRFGKVFAAGGNSHGQTNVPAAAQADVIAISAGDGHVLALKLDGTVLAWGKNDFGQASVPADAQPAFAIAAGRDFSAAVRKDGAVVVWGRGAHSYLRPPQAAVGASKIVAGADYLMVQTDTGLLTWGADGAPEQIPADLDLISVLAAGAHTAFAVRAPYFTKLPGVVKVRAGEPAALTAAVSHLTGLSATWSPSTQQPDSLTLSFADAQPFLATAYTVTAHYETGYSMSATGVLIVLEPPQIANGPTRKGFVRENSSATFAVDAHGSGPMTYQWQKDGLPIPGATARTLTLQPVKAADAGSYNCIVRNSVGEAQSPAREIDVLPAKNGRENATTFAELGSTVVLRADPSNQPAPFSNFVWTKDNAVIPGATGLEFVVDRYTAADAGTYQVTFTDGFGQTGNRTFFTLVTYRYVGPPFHAWLTPSQSLVKPGSKVTLKLGGVESYPDLGFRWQIMRWAGPMVVRDEPGLTSITLDLPAAPDRASVRVTPNDPQLSGIPVYSNIDVRDDPVAPGQLIAYGGPSQLLTGETGEFVAEFAPPAGQITWTKNGVAIPGQTSPLKIQNATTADAGTYVVTTRGSFGSNSARWELDIIERTTILTQPQDATLGPDGAELTMTLSQRSPTGYRVTWFRNGQEYFTQARSGDTASTLTTFEPGTYQVRIYLDTGAVDSAPAVVATAPMVARNAILPGVYLEPNAAAYVRPDRSVVVAATTAGNAVGWLGETVMNADGSVEIPAAWRVTTDYTLLARDPSLDLHGQFTREGVFRGYRGSESNETFSASRPSSANRRREGLYRGKIPGTPGGEIWIFVTALNDTRVYLHDGYALYTGSSSPNALEFDDASGSITYTFSQRVPGYGDVVIGRYVAVREPESTPNAPRVAITESDAGLTLAAAAGGDNPGFQWSRNGRPIAGATDATIRLLEPQPADAGLYTAEITQGTANTTSQAAVAGISTDRKVAGAGRELSPADIRHPNGNVFDQVLLTGEAEAITADVTQGQITRTSFIDLDDDIVQIEFSGPGTLSLVLDASSGPAWPAHYNQPVEYMKGHAGIVITGADERTNVSVFTVGRATAVDPTGRFNTLLPVSASNRPADNGSPLFEGRAAIEYDGVADLAFIAIASTNGKFGGVRAANAQFFASRGFTGIYAPGVAFYGPVFAGDINAFDRATPVLLLGSASDVRITGGDLAQPNGRAVQVGGFTQLRFTDGSDSHGNPMPAQSNRGKLEQDGIDVTAKTVVNP